MKSLYIILFVTLFTLHCTSQNDNTTHTPSSGETEYHFDNTAKKLKSAHSVSITAENLQKTLMEKGMNIFVTVKHHEGAKSVNLDLRPTITIVFGNPKVGTKLMQCSQTSALDQPMKAIIWEDEAGDVWLAYNTVEYLTKRHGTRKCAADVSGKIKTALANFAKAATE